jgi:D-aspartate ligase
MTSRHASFDRPAIHRLVILDSDVTALALVRSAHHLGVKPILFDTQRGIATASRLARLELHLGRERDETVLCLADLGCEAPSALIATADVWLRILAAHRPVLEAAYPLILHPANDVLSICLNKERFSVWCETNGLPAPRFYRLCPQVSIDPLDLPFPLLIRPAETLHSNLTTRIPKAGEVRASAELACRLDEFRRAGATPVLSQSLLGRKLTQYSVGVARAGDRTLTIVARKLRPAPEACSMGTLVQATECAEVERLAREAVTRLGYEGIAEIEVLRDEVSGENFLIEINARPWMQFALGAASGRDLLRFVLTHGSMPQSPARAGRSAVWLDFRADFRVCFRREGLVRTGKLSFLGYLRSLARANVFARWNLTDMGPFWRDACDFVAARFRN